MTLICLFMDICYQHLLTSWHHPALSVYRLLRVSQCDIDSSMSNNVHSLQYAGGIGHPVVSACLHSREKACRRCISSSLHQPTERLRDLLSCMYGPATLQEPARTPRASSPHFSCRHKPVLDPVTF